MARKPNGQNRSAAQLRGMMRRWRQRAWWGIGLAALSGLGVAACWHFDVDGVWWFLSSAGVVSALIGVFGDINAYHDTKKRVAQIERELEA